MRQQAGLALAKDIDANSVHSFPSNIKLLLETTPPPMLPSARKNVDSLLASGISSKNELLSSSWRQQFQALFLNQFGSDNIRVRIPV